MLIARMLLFISEDDGKQTFQKNSKAFVPTECQDCLDYQIEVIEITL